MSTFNGLNARIILCDYAQATLDGKLTIVGGGWSFINPGPIQFGVGVLIDIDPSEMAKAHKFELVLRDADGRPVTGPNGNPLQFNGTAPPQPPPADYPAGMPIKRAQAFNFAGVQLQPSSRYQVVFTIDNSSIEVEDFCTRPAQPQLKAS